ncbi:MAG: hypothetical protein ACYTEU_10880 [Planctomycetota bacterium]
MFLKSRTSFIVMPDLIRHPDVDALDPGSRLRLGRDDRLKLL